MVEAPIRLSVRCLAGVAVAILAAATAEPSQSIVTLRQGGLLAAHANGFTPDARHRANRDAWGYLTPNVKGAIQFLERAHGFRATHGYSKVIQGFAADLTDKQIEALRLEPLVEAMTVTISMSARQQRAPWGVRSLTALPNGSAADIEQPWTGGVTVYVIDSGITASADLNLKKHVNFTSGPNTDCHGHGTHVAGTIGARDNSEGVTGVAPGVALVGVKVVDCKGEGSSATLLKGVDWVAAHADGPSVVNLSLGGGVSLELDAGIKAAVDFGIFFSIAAGNNSQDACLTSPSLNGFSAGIVTVAAIDVEGAEPAFSNFGGCVDLWAPGVAVASTARGGADATLTLSGTSMAAPHVAGVAALFLASNPAATPAAVELALIGYGAVPGTTSKDGRTILLLRPAGHGS